MWFIFRTILTFFCNNSFYTYVKFLFHVFSSPFLISQSISHRKEISITWVTFRSKKLNHLNFLIPQNQVKKTSKFKFKFTFTFKFIIRRYRKRTRSWSFLFFPGSRVGKGEKRSQLLHSPSSENGSNLRVLRRVRNRSRDSIYWRNQRLPWPWLDVSSFSSRSVSTFYSHSLPSSTSSASNSK